MQRNESHQHENLRALLTSGQIGPVRDVLLKCEVPTRAARLAPHLAFMREAGLVDEAIAIADRALECATDVAPGSELAFVSLERVRCLIRIGATNEALGRLQREPALRALQETIAYRMAWLQLRVARWEYEEALPHIEKLLLRTDLDPRDRSTLITTRVAALIFVGQLESASALFEQTDLELKSRSAWPLRFRLLEALAQLEWERGNIEQLRLVLTRAEALLQEAPWLDGTMARFFLQKWEVIVSAGPTSSDELSVLRERARSLGQWEAVRDIDLAAVQLLRDRTILARLYYQTPFATFRSYLKRICAPLGLDVPHMAKIRIGTSDSGDAIEFDVRTGRFSNGAVLKPGGLDYRIMSALVRDAYRPLRTAELFYELHPDQYYSPHHATKRVQQAVRRFRASIEESGIPLTLDSVVGGYALVRESTSIALSVSSDWLQVDGIDRANAVDVYDISKVFRTKPFAATEASENLDRPLRSVQKLLSDLVGRGYLQRAGDGRASRYVLTTPEATSNS